MRNYTNQFNMNWKKINLEAENWQGKQQRLPIGHKKWAGHCRPCPIGSTANDDVIIK